MALVAVYDKDGNMKMKEPVDARECVEHCGFTMEPPEGKTDEGKKDPKPKGKKEKE
ncbi:hypothetical protein ARNL5_01738 [Anaerolineae bacterium]|nr:hypothetical protein ARNL5_01738 [Anaerolineae bacterium]